MKLLQTLVSITILVLSAGAVSAAELPFPEAMTEMFQSNQELKASQAEVRQREYERKAAMGLFCPVVSVSSMYTHLSDPITLDMTSVRDAIAASSAPGAAAASALASRPISVAQAQANIQAQLNAGGNWTPTLVEQDFWKNSVTIKQPIWMGGKIIAANKAAAARVDESNAKYRYTKNKLVTELVERYFGLRLLLQVVDVRKEVLDGMDKHLTEAVALEKSGIISNAERLHAEVSRSNADREYKKAKRDADISETGLKDTLATSDPVRPATPLFILDKVDDLDYFKAQARERNPLLHQIAANRSLSRQAWKKEFARFQPEVFGFGNYSLPGWHNSAVSPDWFVGVGATMTVFEGFSGWNSMKAADAQIARVDQMERKAFADIEALVDKCYNEMMKSREQMSSLDSSLSFANEFLRVRQKAFQEGLATSTDLTDAQLNLSQVKIERLKALYEYDVALARLLEVCGISEQFETFRNAAGAEVER